MDRVDIPCDYVRRAHSHVLREFYSRDNDNPCFRWTFIAVIAFVGYYARPTQRIDLEVKREPLKLLYRLPNLTHRDIAWPTPLPGDRRGGNTSIIPALYVIAAELRI